MQQIPLLIESLREQRGLSETQLATNSGMARMTLTRRMANPGSFTASELERVAETLGVTLLDLLRGDAA